MATLDQLGRRLSFDEEGAIIGDESDVDPMSFAGMGIVKPDTELAPKSMGLPTNPDPLSSRPRATLMDTAVSGREARNRYAQEVLDTERRLREMDREDRAAFRVNKPAAGFSLPRPQYGLDATRADFAGIMGRGGQEEKITGVPTLTADTATGQTVKGAAPVVKAEMKADAKAQAAGAGGDEGTDNLALGELLARGIGSVYQGATGRELGGNIPEMLSALRQRREAQKLKEQEITREELMRSGALESLGEMFEGQVPGAKDYAKRFRGSAADFIRALGQFTGTEQKQKGLDVRAQEKGLAPVSEEVRTQNKAFADAIRPNNPRLADFVENYGGTARDAVAAYAKAEGGRRTGEQADVVKPVAEAGIKLKGAQTDVAKAQARKLNTIGLGAQKEVKSGVDEVGKIAPEGKPLTEYQRTQIETKLANTANSKAFRGTGELANDLAELERIAPGSVSRGVVPEWLTTDAMLAWDKYKRATDPRVRDFMTAFSRMRNVKRHEQYGSALNAGEIKASLSELSDRPLESGPEVFIGQLASMRRAAAKKAANDYRPFYNTSAKDSVDRILIQGTGADTHFGKNGIYADEGGWYNRSSGGSDRVRVVSPDGKSGTIQRSQLEAAIKAGYKEVQ